MKRQFKEIFVALANFFKEMLGFIKYCSRDLKSEGKTWKDYFH